jgi:hypothetical protein
MINDGYLVDPIEIATAAAQHAKALALYQGVTLPYAQFNLARAQQDAARNTLKFLEDRDRARDAYFSPYLQAGLNNSGIANRAAKRFSQDTALGKQDIALQLADARQRILYELLLNRGQIGLNAADNEFNLFTQSTQNYPKTIEDV